MPFFKKIISYKRKHFLHKENSLSEFPVGYILANLQNINLYQKFEKEYHKILIYSTICIK